MTDDLEHCPDEKKIKEQESVNGLDFLNATYGYQELTLIGNFFEHSAPAVQTFLRAFNIYKF